MKRRNFLSLILLLLAASGILTYLFATIQNPPVPNVLLPEGEKYGTRNSAIFYLGRAVLVANQSFSIMNSSLPPVSLMNNSLILTRQNSAGQLRQYSINATAGKEMVIENWFDTFGLALNFTSSGNTTAYIDTKDLGVPIVLNKFVYGTSTSTAYSGLVQSGDNLLRLSCNGIGGLPYVWKNNGIPVTVYCEFRIHWEVGATVRLENPQTTPLGSNPWSRFVKTNTTTTFQIIVWTGSSYSPPVNVLVQLASGTGREIDMLWVGAAGPASKTLDIGGNSVFLGWTNSTSGSYLTITFNLNILASYPGEFPDKDAVFEAVNNVVLAQNGSHSNNQPRIYEVYRNPLNSGYCFQFADRNGNIFSPTVPHPPWIIWQLKNGTQIVPYTECSRTLLETFTYSITVWIYQITPATLSANMTLPLPNRKIQTVVIIIPLLPFKSEENKVLFKDDFLYQTNYLSNQWTVDQYQAVSEPTGVYTQSGYLVFSQPSATTIKVAGVHVTQSAWNIGLDNTILYKRKLTVSLLPFKARGSFSSTISIGFGPLYLSGAYPGKTPYGTPNSGLDSTGNQNQCLVRNDYQGIEQVTITNDADIQGETTALTCGIGGLKNVGVFSALDPTLYTVVTVEYAGLPNIPSTQWVYFRVYQEDKNNLVTEKGTFNYTTNIAPFANTNYVLIQHLNVANPTGSLVSQVDLVQLQSYGSPVDLKVPLTIPFPTCASPSCPTGFIGLLAALASLMGLGNIQFGAINLFLITMVGTAGLAIVWTKRVYVTLIAGILDISMFIYAGLLPTWILFLMLLTTAFLTLLLFRALIGFGGGGDSPGGDSSEGGTSGGIE